MNPKHSPLCSLILSGGKSSRMGSDKGQLVYHEGKTQIAYLSDLAAEYTEKTFLSLNPKQAEQQAHYSNKIILDSYPITSPLNGILSAMKAHPAYSWLVIAVDMPRIDAEAIKLLLQHRKPEADATAFPCAAKKGVEPLFTIWEAHSFDKIMQIWQAQEMICPRHILAQLDVKLVSEGISAQTLVNANTPEEYQRYSSL